MIAETMVAERMIVEGISRILRGAVTIALALSIVFPVLCSGQTSTPGLSNAPVLSNPRAPSDDPRVGLKGGLYDAGEASFGMQRLATLPKPPGFAPGEATAPPTP